MQEITYVTMTTLCIVREGEKIDFQTFWDCDRETSHQNKSNFNSRFSPQYDNAWFDHM